MIKSPIHIHSSAKKENIQIHTEVEKIQRKFYDSENNLILPRDADCYFNWKSVKFNDTTLNTKLKELGYLLSQGFDLNQSISDYKANRDSYAKSSVSSTFIYYLMYIRYQDYYHFASSILEKLSENKLIKLLIDELNVVYNCSKHEVNCMFWDDIIVIETAKAVKGEQSDKDKLIAVISSSEMIRVESFKKYEVNLHIIKTS